MRNFALVLNRNGREDREMFETYAADLRQSYPKVLLIAPNILLFQTEKNLKTVFGSLPTSTRLDDQVILVEVGRDFLALGLPVEKMQNLATFFRQ